MSYEAFFARSKLTADAALSHRMGSSDAYCTEYYFRPNQPFPDLSNSLAYVPTISGSGNVARPITVSRSYIPGVRIIPTL
jgi:hypothetical protein